MTAGLADGLAQARRLLASTDAAAAVRLGIADAGRDVERWSRRSEWACEQGCEGLLQVRVAERLFEVIERNNLGGLGLEARVSLVNSEGTTRRGRPPLSISTRQRTDLAVWTKAGDIYAIFEIKRDQRESGWKDDLRKLRDLLRRYGRSQGNYLRYAVFGAYLSAPTLDGLAAKRERFQQVTSSFSRPGAPLKAEFAPVHPYVVGDDDHWHFTSASVVLKPCA